MSNLFLDFFKEPAPKETIKDKDKIKSMYTRYSWQIFLSCYFAYTVSYIGRKNLSISMKTMSESLGMSNTQLSLLGSSFYFTYAFGKFFNGLLADRANARTFISSAFILIAICSFGLAFSANFIAPGATLLLIFCILWGANGLFQSMTYPPIAKSLSFWFSGSERGTRWSIVSTSHQIGVFAAGLVVNFALSHFGWKGAFYVPAFISALTGIALFMLMRDKPVTLGLPSVEEYRGEAKKDSKSDDKKRNYFQTFAKSILGNPMIWLLIASLVFVYVVRTGAEDWLVKYFEEHGDSRAKAISKLTVSSVVGSLGAIVGAFVSDKVFKSRRTPINLIFLFTLLISLFLFATNPAQSRDLEFIYASVITLCAAGLQTMIGLCIVESCKKDVAAAANGFAGMFSYIGAAIASFGTGNMIDRFGWNGAFIFWGASVCAAIVLSFIVLPMEKKNKGIA